MGEAGFILQIKELSYSYTPGREILKNINLSIFKNEFTVIAGLNGSGKTTLMNIICGILKPYSGGITLNKKDHSKMTLTEIASEIGYVMQECETQLFMPTVYSEIANCLKNSGKSESEKDEIINKLLNMTGLQDKRDSFPLELNRTGRFKTVFASVLAMGAGILLLDEPFAGHDSRSCRIIMDNLKYAHQKGYTILLSSHNINIVAEYANRFIIINDGEIILDGALQDILGSQKDLKGAGIIPPAITVLSRKLRESLPLEKDFYSPAQLAQALIKLKRS